MGAVYYAIHPRLNVEVAVKILPPHLVDQDPKLADRFVAEARMAATLASDHVVRVLDVDRDSGTSFLVMEYVEGESAEGYLQRRKKEGAQALSEAEALEIVIAATRGLAAAHGKGIIHRDIKPDNILIPKGVPGKAKLADLGLAKPESGKESLGTQPNVAMGTPGFMAPEQIEDTRSADRASDVFSMGATLYALLSGHPPFRGSSLAAVLRDTANREAEALPAHVSAATRSLIRKCLEKSPDQRYADGLKLLQALEELRKGGVTPVTIPESAIPTILARTPTSRKHLGWGVAALFLLAALAIYFVARKEAPPAVASEAKRTAAEPPPTLKLDVGGVEMDLIYIKPGRFTMGGTEAPGAHWEMDERPPHPVTFTRGYYLGKYEVTRGQFAAFVKATGYKTQAEIEGKAYGRGANGGWVEIPSLNWRNPNFSQTNEHPVTCISWNDAKAYCDWAAQKSRRTVRLPTEAEWEYACRAGTKTVWSFGDQETSMADHGWTDKNSEESTYPVGQKKPNPWGFYDMHGNVWEWCQDWAGPYPENAIDPAGPARGERRCLRGGSWSDGPGLARSALRPSQDPAHRGAHHGFRVVIARPE